MRVLVCGGRDYENRKAVFEALDSLHANRVEGITLVIHGKARGADSLADEWARLRGVPVSAKAAKWKEFGKAAGSMRNAEMLRESPDLVVAFPGGAGTTNMKRQSASAGVPIWQPFLPVSKRNPLPW